MLNATSFEQLPTPDVTASMSGLEFMQSTLNGTVPGPPIGAMLNYHLHVVEDGKLYATGSTTCIIMKVA